MCSSGFEKENEQENEKTGKVTPSSCLSLEEHVSFPTSTSKQPPTITFSHQNEDPDSDQYCLLFAPSNGYYLVFFYTHTRLNGTPITYNDHFFTDNYSDFVKKFCSRIGIREEHMDHGTPMLQNIAKWGFPPVVTTCE